MLGIIVKHTLEAFINSVVFKGMEMNKTHGRSPQEIVEDMLLEIIQPRFNISREDSKRLCIHRKEIGADIRIEAESLLVLWECSKSQADRVRDLFSAKKYLVSRQI